MYSAESAANAFLELARRSEKSLTNMQLQKLVYIAHGYSLAKLGKPLFHNNIHAFEWGPVIPNLYKTLKHYGAGEVKDYISTDAPPVGEVSQEMEIIREVWHDYGELSGFELSDLTHRKGTPWSETWRTNPFGVISDELIAEYYRRELYERFDNQP
ncbi:MAG: hypothetical protein AVDCRST_MAG74-394 [uncultured Pyrinomonadaceae bacterium]|uniref:Antitoxin SocA-like Panacea domain-containing protein n=1 Tax=uncultured Pyrinomonadaceae bacterium TaxID=2283094 RepID=A0A6J4NCX2_9BACT|nr:MAG: hypothetical protein AVDCRST_MAG74-394 [uncultured Pyrinomonadaceae bacterium]